MSIVLSCLGLKTTDLTRYFAKQKQPQENVVSVDSNADPENADMECEPGPSHQAPRNADIICTMECRPENFNQPPECAVISNDLRSDSENFNQPPQNSEVGTSIECNICLAHINQDRQAAPDSCEHRFCATCLTEWGNTSTSCPVDHLMFRSIRVYDRLNNEIGKITVDNQCRGINSYHCEICRTKDDTKVITRCEGCSNTLHQECREARIVASHVKTWLCRQCLSATGDVSSPKPGTPNSPQLPNRKTIIYRLRKRNVHWNHRAQRKVYNLRRKPVRSNQVSQQKTISRGASTSRNIPSTSRSIPSTSRNIRHKSLGLAKMPSSGRGLRSIGQYSNCAANSAS